MYILELPQYLQHNYVPENKEENYLEIYIFQASCTLYLPLLNIPNRHEFMNYLFANLLAEWL